MKRFLTLVSLLCSVCILFSSCAFLPEIALIANGWETVMEELSEENSDTPSVPEEDEVPVEDEESSALLYALEKKYGIDIEDPDHLLTPENCIVLDESLAILSIPVIDGILEFLEEDGRDFSLVFADETYDALGETIFTYDEIEITIYAPRDTYDPEMTNGITVETIVHEFGHVLHDIFEDEYGIRPVKETWCQLNGSSEYGDEWDENAEHYFAYDYGMTDYYEDVATVFEDLAAYPVVTEGRLAKEENDPLYFKAKYLYEMTDGLFDLSESTLFDPFFEAKERRGDYDSFEESLELFGEWEPGVEPELEDPFGFDLFDDLFGFSFAEDYAV